MPKDTLLPAALIERVAGFPLDSVAVLLLAWGRADRDGICAFEPEWTAAVQPLFCGLLATYPAPLLAGAGAREYAWLPDVSAHPPPPSLRREVGSDPPPPRDLVRAVLAVRLGREPTDAECRSACPRAYGGKRAASVPTDSSEEAVFRAYACHVYGEEEAEARGLGPAGRRLIRAALAELGGGDAAARDLTCLFTYVFDSDERGPKWLRDNKYTGLDNLTVLSKLRSRVDAARAWASKNEDRADTASSGVDLGPLGAFRRRVPFTTE